MPPAHNHDKVINVYGIPNCTSVKKTLVWLAEHAATPVVFHNYKKHTLTAEPLKIWLQHIGSAQLINRRGTTWRGLNERDQHILDGQDSHAIIALLIQHPSVIKRPIIIWPDHSMTVGFYDTLFAQKCLA